jgi:GNAT superfamily N-acetyltransferase
MSSAILDVTISPITSESDFLPFAILESAAFAGPQTTLFNGPSATPSLSAARHAKTFATDPTARYFKACLPTGQIVGIARWHLFPTAGPHFPWSMEGFAPDANLELLKWFFGSLDEKRNAFMVPRGKGYLYMAILAVDPGFQRMGVGRKLLDWGLEKADRERLECWIEASPAGKGLYEKVGWREVDVIDVELRRWGWEGEEKVARTVSMFRGVGGKGE